MQEYSQGGGSDPTHALGMVLCIVQSIVDRKGETVDLLKRLLSQEPVTSPSEVKFVQQSRKDLGIRCGKSA